VSGLEAATELGLGAFGSASLLQGRLAGELPEEVVLAFPEAATPARRALQFSRSAPGLTTALVGVSDVAHASENFGLAAIPPAEPDRILGIFDAGGN
jgi:aryl-alcohol dehydrogenase-like predicted oxidoreductase